MHVFQVVCCFCFYWILVLGGWGFNSVVDFIDLPGIKMRLVLWYFIRWIVFVVVRSVGLIWCCLRYCSLVWVFAMV